MENIDEHIRFRSIFDPDIFPQKFEERSDALLASLRTSAPRRQHRRAAFILKFAAAIVLIAALLTGAAYAAYSLSGGAYFRQLFSAVAARSPDSYGYMNTDQLDQMASSTVGNVINTDELSVDVLGVLVSGNTAHFDIKITAKKLDTVLYDTGIEPLMNYRFHDHGDFYLMADGSKNGSSGSIQYIYSDTDKSLEPNQFIIRYIFISEEALKGKTYMMSFKDFGYFDFSEPDQFKQLYTGEWSFNLAFDPVDDTSRTVLSGQGLSAGEYEFTVDSVSISPLSCIVKISNAKEYFDKYDDRWLNVWEALNDKVGDFSVSLSDGTKLDSNQFEGGHPGGGEPGYELQAMFKVPISVDDVVSVTLGGTEIPLN